MKEIAALALVCILIIAILSGCSNGSAPDAAEQAANFLPESTAVPAGATAAPFADLDPELPDTVDIPLDSVVDATVAPEEDAAEAEPDAAEAAPDPVVEAQPTVASAYADYNYAMLTDTSFGFVYSYPTTWKNLPGKYTVCFQEQPTDGDFPARVAVTSKKLAHKPDSDTTVKQFQAYAKEIYSQYDPSTFEFSALNSNATFMGKQAYSITYLAYSGDIEIKGYMCCCAIDYTLYVFHFCSSYDDYEAMGSVMTRMRDSVTRVK